MKGVNARVVAVIEQGQQWHAVRVDNLDSVAQAKQKLQQVKRQGYRAYIVRRQG